MSSRSAAPLGVVLCLTLLPVAAAARDQSRDTLIGLEKEWSDAFLAGDRDRVAALLADDFVGIDGRGFVSNKANELAEVGAKSPNWQVLSETLDDFKVRVFGGVGVVNSRNTERVRIQGQEETVRYRRTTVWVERAGRWQCVAFHASRILESPPP